MHVVVTLLLGSRQHVRDIPRCLCLQVFVANPNKTKPIIEILVGNKDKLLKYLTDFHSDKGESRCC